MKITKEWLKEKNVCADGYEWFVSQNETDPVTIIRKLKKINGDWAYWLLSRKLNKNNNVRWAINSSEAAGAAATAAAYAAGAAAAAAAAGAAGAAAAGAAGAAATAAANTAAAAAGAAAAAAAAGAAGAAAAGAAGAAATAGAASTYAANKTINYGIKLLKEQLEEKGVTNEN